MSTYALDRMARGDVTPSHHGCSRQRCRPGLRHYHCRMDCRPCRSAWPRRQYGIEPVCLLVFPAAGAVPRPCPCTAQRYFQRTVSGRLSRRAIPDLSGDAGDRLGRLAPHHQTGLARHHRPERQHDGAQCQLLQHRLYGHSAVHRAGRQQQPCTGNHRHSDHERGDGRSGHHHARSTGQERSFQAQGRPRHRQVADQKPADHVFGRRSDCRLYQAADTGPDPAVR